MTTSRRGFLKTAVGSSAVVSFGGTAPSFLLQATAEENAAERDNVLVVVQLSGGNDGLNTVAPFRDETYLEKRPTLAVRSDVALRIDQSFGFHPAARGLADLLEAGQLAIVQGVGYSNPNRSHFESMDIWHTCRRKTETRNDGWLGRYLERAGSEEDSDAPALHLGPEKQPLALASSDVQVPSIRSLKQFQLRDGNNSRLKNAIREINGKPAATGNSLLGFVQNNSSAALSTAERIESIGAGYRSQVSWPDSGLAGKLRSGAQLIDSGMAARIYYVTLDGFDTHARQAGAHAALLREFSSAVAAFIQDINDHGHGDRVTLFGFSEFGRRLQENASEGTDHGAAAPVFLAGNSVESGLIGKHPSLTDLHDGDVKHHTDFRQVYAALLEHWLGTASTPILGQSFKPVLVFKQKTRA